MQSDTAEAYDGEPPVPVRLCRITPVGRHYQHRRVRDRGPATATMQSIFGAVGHHMPCLLRYDRATPITSGSHPFLATPETLSKRCPVSDRRLARDLLPDDRHNYRLVSYTRRKSGQRTKSFPWFPPWPCATIPSMAIAINLSVPMQVIAAYLRVAQVPM